MPGGYASMHQKVSGANLSPGLKERPVAMVIGHDSTLLRVVLSGLVAQSARIVLVDPNARALQRVAEAVGGDIDLLNIDVLQRFHCNALAQHWQDQPLDLLLHFQPLYHSQNSIDALGSVARVTRATAQGLREAHGSVFYFWRHDDTRPLPHDASLYLGMGPRLERALGSPMIPVAGICLSGQSLLSNPSRALRRLLTRLI